MSADPSRALVRALAAYLGPIDDLNVKTRDWSSAMFCGMRHELTFTVPRTEQSCAAAAAIAEADLPMTGHFVADVVLVASRDDGTHLRLTIEALTIEDA
ncbi:MAG: hypothetical protein ACKVOP_11810 [Sphingomonadaceae bacterium]